MNPQVQIIAVVSVIGLAAFVLRLVKNRKLREEYSLLWLVSIVVLGVLAFHRPFVAHIARLLGVAYAPSAIFIVAFAIGFLLVLHFSVAISRLVERDKRLTQEIGLLQLRIHELERECEYTVQARLQTGTEHEHHRTECDLEVRE